MKKIIIALSAAVLVTVSCKKTETIKEVAALDNGVLVSNASCMKNKIPFAKLFENAQDDEERQIDQKHYQLIKSMLPLANKKEFKNLLAKSKTSKNNCLEVNEILELHNGNIAPANNTECNLLHEGLLYRSVIFIANAETADFSLSPIFSPGIELYDDETGADGGNHDVIFGWYVDEANDTIEINLGERDYKKTKRPIMVASLELCEGQTERVVKITEQSLARRTAFSPKIDGLRINYRYDNSNYSEVYVSAIHTTTTAVVNGANGKLMDIHKNNIGRFVNLGFNWEFRYFSINNPANERICYNAYEYDWYASGKDLGYCYLKGSISGSKYYLSLGRRKFQTEWYAFPVGNLSSYEIPLGSLTTNPSLFTWSKGLVSIKK